MFEKTLAAAVVATPNRTIRAGLLTTANATPHAAIATALASTRCFRSNRPSSGIESNEPSGYPTNDSAVNSSDDVTSNPLATSTNPAMVPNP